MNCYGSPLADLALLDRAILVIVRRERLCATTGLATATIAERLRLFIGADAASAIRPARIRRATRRLEALGLLAPHHTATRLRWRKA